MSETATTPNGYEIKHPASVISATEFRQRMSNEYGIDGSTPAERIKQLKQLSVEGIAILLEDINKSVQGSADSRMSHDEMIKFGGRPTIKPEDRYDVFLRLVEDIKNCPDDINPARVGDVLALGTVLLHAFHDGNGRTARIIGLMARDIYDSDDYQSEFDIDVEPRDLARAEGRKVIYGYRPRFPEGFDQSDPNQVSAYLSDLLQNESDGAYQSSHGQAPLRAQATQTESEQ